MLNHYIYTLNNFNFIMDYYFFCYKLFFFKKKIINSKLFFLKQVYFKSYKNIIYFYYSFLLFNISYNTLNEYNSYFKCGFSYLPKKYKTFTVLKSPHTDKKSREQFHLIQYKSICNYPMYISMYNSYIVKYNFESGFNYTNYKKVLVDN